MIGAQIGQFVQRKQAEEVLRESEERFRNLTELSSDWYWEQDENFRFTMFSENLHRRGGPTIESLLGKARWELPTLNMTEADWTAHRALLEAHQPFRDLQWHRLDDAGKAADRQHQRRADLRLRGRFRGYRGIGRDITESKRSEEVLRRFRASMDMSDDMILLVDRKSHALHRRQRGRLPEPGLLARRASADESGGYPPMTTGAVRNRLRRDDRDRSHAGDAKRVSLQGRLDPAVRIPAPRHALGDDWIIVVTARDIRERIAQEEALRKSNERFDMAVRATNDVIWDWDLVTDEIWWNENYTKVFGLPREAADRSIQSWYQGIHPDDQGRVIAGVHRLIGSGGENWSDEYRFRRQDGSWVHVLDRGQVIRDESGRAVRMIGAMADISSRKQAEERIHNQAMRQRLIAEFGQQAFASTDVEDVLKRAVELVSVSLSADYCTVLELDRDGKQLLLKAASGWPEELKSRPGGADPPGGASSSCSAPRAPHHRRPDRATSDFRIRRLAQARRAQRHPGPHIRNRRNLRNTLGARARRAPFRPGRRELPAERGEHTGRRDRAQERAGAPRAARAVRLCSPDCPTGTCSTTGS